MVMRRVVLSVLISFFISFSLLLLFLINQHHDETVNPNGVRDSLLSQKKFYDSISNSTQKKIFIIGSSQVGGLNTTRIHNDLLDNGYNYEIYNLALSSDTPLSRVKTIDWIVDAHPNLIVYGISPRDFQNTKHDINQFEVNAEITPSPHKFFNEIYSLITRNAKFEFDFIQSPKFVVLKAVRGSNEPSSEIIKADNMPFFINGIDMKNTKTELELMNSLAILPQFDEVLPYEKNRYALALNDILQKMDENKIKTVLLILPQSDVYLHYITDSDNNSFNSILKTLKQKHDVKIVSFFEKYRDKSIWHDVYHPSINNKTGFYSDDVAEIILQTVQ